MQRFSKPLLSIISIALIVSSIWFSSSPIKLAYAQAIQEIVGISGRTTGTAWRRLSTARPDRENDEIIGSGTMCLSPDSAQSPGLGEWYGAVGAWQTGAPITADNGVGGQTANCVLAVATHIYNFASSTFNNVAQSVADGVTSGTQAISTTGNSLFNGLTWDRKRSVSGINLSAGTSTGIQPVAPFATWTITSAPAAAAQATASKAAGAATIQHVVTSWQVCLYTATAATVPVAQAFVVRDGATGAGTVKHNGAVGSGTIQGNQCVSSPPGNTWIGTANTALTIEFVAAPPANVLQTVSLAGYSTP